ncbi:Cullin [Pilobolus umbonatus]|nr:Cullin [Pilobolus umbonatus]
MSLRRKAINFDEHFTDLIDILNGIYSLSSQQREIKGMTMYQVVYDLCVAVPKPFTEEVFNGIAEYIDKHTVNECVMILAHDDIVTAYAKAFERFALAAEYMSRGCYYLDRINKPNSGSMSRFNSGSTTHVHGKYKKQQVEALALSLWKNNVLFTIRDKHQNKLFYQIFELIRQDRDGVDAPHNTIKSVVTSLVQVNAYTDQPLQLYIEEFERPYLVHTKRYYEAEAARQIATDSISSFMRKANERLSQEIMRNNQYCHSTSHGRIVKEFEAQYTTAYQERIIDEFEILLNQERFHDCTLAYNLLSRIPDGLKQILEIYQTYITKLGKDIVAQLGSSVIKNPRTYVDQLLELHTKYYQINQKIFASDPLFTAAVDKAFRTIINNSIPSNGPETLARYCDIIMKKNTAKKELVNGKRPKKSDYAFEVDEVDQEEKLMKMVTLFKYVDDKDIFQKFYSRTLAKRLIYNTSASEEMELSMINRLKEICGVEYTSKLNRMFTDMSLSSDLNPKFKSFLRENQDHHPVSMDILVLTAGAWPLNQKEDGLPENGKLHIPRVLENCIGSFEKFYSEQYNGRRLLWQWNLTRGEIRVNYLDRNYELQVSLFQMILLLLFNCRSSYLLEDLMSQSGLNMNDMMKSLKPLVDMQLLESSNGLLSNDCEVKLNVKFSR